MNKLRAFTLRDAVRGVIGQPEPRFQVEDVLTKQRILLVRCRPECSVRRPAN